jgi:anthranilate phosphoribosyltransferase
MNSFREVIQKVGRGEKLAKDLTREEARQALEWIFEGKAGDFQIGAFFAAMRMKGETAEETAGLVEAVRGRAIQLHPTKTEEAVDFGDPYDGKVKTLHLTVPVALILAAAGVPVILHSTPDTPVKRGVETEKVLEALGVRASSEPKRLAEILEEENFLFLPTEKWAPDFGKLRPHREAYGLRPFANHIEKIFNLANATTQAVGVYHRPYLEPMGKALALLGTPRIFIVQGVEGFTELFLSRKTLVLQIEGGKESTFWTDPAEYGLKGEEEPAPGDRADEHAKRIEALLAGAPGNARQSILWNAGVKLFWMRKKASIGEGLREAEKLLDSRKALGKLEALRRAAQEETSSQKV